MYPDLVRAGYSFRKDRQAGAMRLGRTEHPRRTPAAKNTKQHLPLILIRMKSVPLKAD
jgi:hypothetical protein